jgi:hypothetical protein
MLHQLIVNLKDRGILKNALSQFESYADQIEIENDQSYITAILEVGDKVDHENIGLTSFSSNFLCARLVFRFLRRINDSSYRGELLLNCFQASNGLSIIGMILQSEEKSRENSEPDKILNDDQFELLKAEFVKKINDLATISPIELLSNEYLVSILYKWKKWGNEAEVIDWLKKQTESAEGCINFLKKFTRKSTSQGMGDFVATVSTKIDLESIENFLKVPPIQEKIFQLNEIDFDFDFEAQEAIRAFNQAIDNREHGITDF